MKHIAKYLCLLLIAATLLPSHVSAATVAAAPKNTIYFEDGSYITIALSIDETRASSNKTAKKTYIYHGNDGDEEWRAVLSGTFIYTGTSSLCTAAGCSVSITDTDWYEISNSATKSGNSALADVTMGRKFIGITIDKESISMRLTCDANGNVS